MTNAETCATWADQAGTLAKGADRAFAAGDMVAAVALAVGAAQCLEIARLLERGEHAAREGGDG